jgi:hypothetical protein
MSDRLPPSYIGAILFAAVPFALFVRRNMVSNRKNNEVVTMPDVDNIVALMEKLVQKDEGGRGIAEIVLPSGELLQAAKTMASAKKVAIITGFPCMIQHTPPTETDGPLGAVALAKCLLALGKDVVIATDDCNAEVLLACTRTASAHKESLPGTLRSGTLTMEAFAAAAESDEKEEQRMRELANSVDLVIAIERSGPCLDGGYRTMRGYDMTHLVAPLEMLLMPPGVMDEVENSASGATNSATQRRDVGGVPRSIGIGRWLVVVWTSFAAAWCVIVCCGGNLSSASSFQPW